MTDTEKTIEIARLGIGHAQAVVRYFKADSTEDRAHALLWVSACSARAKATAGKPLPGHVPIFPLEIP